MAKIIAIANPKGGVGKTTTTINLGASLAIAEKSVLIIDFDPAGSVSDGLGIHKGDIKCGVFEIFSGTANLLDTIYHLDFLEMDVIPSNVYSSEQEIRLTEMAKNRIRLKRQLSNLLEIRRINYEYILIDTPPLLNDLTVGALLAADSVLIPLQCGHFALKAVDRVLEMIERIKKSANPNLEIEGILLNFYEKGTRVSFMGADKANKAFHSFLFKTVIPKNVAIGYASFLERPAALINITAPGAKAYLELAEELLERERVKAAGYREEVYFSLPDQRYDYDA